VRVWDVRIGAAVHTIAGPRVCGDALDVFSDDALLVGSYAPSEQLCIYDLRAAALLHVAPWPARPNGGAKLYAAQIRSADGAPGLLAAGGVRDVDGAGEVRVLARDGLNTLGRALLPRGVCGLDTAAKPSGCRIAVAGGDGSVRVLEWARSAYEGAELS
jgi:hypothetical protein